MAFELINFKTCYRTLTELFDGGRFPHALLIEGRFGSGRRSLAFYATSLLLCRGEDKPCGECLSCRKIVSKNHPDVKFLDCATMDGKNQLESLRQFIKSAFIIPNESEFCVFILANADTLPIPCQNVLLKILEEPPKTAIFILTALSKGTLIETVQSRVSAVKTPTLSNEQLLEGIKINLPDASAEHQLMLSESCETVGEALQIDGDSAVAKCIKDANELISLAVAGKKFEILVLLSKYNKEQKLFLKLLSLARTRAIELSAQGDQKIPPLRCKRFADIINSSYDSGVQNVSIPLISAVIAGELSKA